MLFEVGVLYRILNNMYVSYSGSITSVGGRESYFLLLCSCCKEGFPLPQCAWDGLRYVIVALPGPPK